MCYWASEFCFYSWGIKVSEARCFSILFGIYLPVCLELLREDLPVAVHINAYSTWELQSDYWCSSFQVNILVNTNLSMWETCPLLLLLLKLSRSSRISAESSLMVCLSGTARWYLFLLFWLSLVYNLEETKLVLHACRMLSVFAMLLLSLKTFLLFKMQSRYEFSLLFVLSLLS